MTIITERFTPGFRLIDGSALNAMIDQINAGSSLGGVNYYVNETIGSDVVGNDGLNPFKPLKTIARALALESAQLTRLGLSSVGRNSVINFWGTQHFTGTLTWNLPATHLVGLCAPERRGKRARISVSGSTAFSYLVSVTAQGCYFSNFGTFYGFDSATNNVGPWSDTGGRNCYNNVEFLGFGNSTASTGTANKTTSRSFVFNTDNGETSWYNCVFGADTYDRGAANYNLEIAGAAPRLYFENCDFEARLGAGGTAGSYVLIGASGIDRYARFVGCRFGNFSASAMAQALDVNAAPGGTVLLDQCTIMYNITAWQTSPGAQVQMNMTAPGAGGGKAITNA